MNSSHMEEFDVIENYLRRGDYPIGIAKDQTCEENVEITASSTKASCITRRKPTLHLCCMLAPSMAVFHMSFSADCEHLPTGHQHCKNVWITSTRFWLPELHRTIATQMPKLDQSNLIVFTVNQNGST